MGIDYSDIINGIIIFLLFGLLTTSVIFNICLLSERKYLKSKIQAYERILRK